MPSVRWVVEGQVQGVGFRWFVNKLARRLSLRGWVRNLPNASVEVVALGGPGALQKLEAELRKGPPGADVHQLKRSEAPPEVEQSESFQIRH